MRIVAAHPPLPQAHRAQILSRALAQIDQDKSKSKKYIGNEMVKKEIRNETI